MTSTTVKFPYALYKSLPNANDNNDNDSGEFLIRRITDGDILLAAPAPLTLRITSPLAAARSAANLLNHENLVSIHDELVLHDHHTLTVGVNGKTEISKRMLLWDYCDAGTLQGVLDEYEQPMQSTTSSSGAGAGRGGGGGGGGFLPESFVWHVGLGLLRALQWLHEGIRDTYDVVPSRRGTGWKRVRGKTEAEVGWMPVLHRDIKASNIFLQHPRGIETYGAVKLGGFGRCWVSGSVSKTRETPVVAMEEEDDVSLGMLRDRKGRWQRGGKGGGLGVPKSHRPYTQGSELFAVGGLLYRMMVGRPLPTVEECASCGCFHITSNDVAEYNPCHDNCVGDVNTDEVFKPWTGYTAYLKALVTLLLRLNRRDEWPASDALNTAWQGFENWAANTDDGRQYRDIFDDIWFRKQNQARLKKRRQEVDGDADAMEVDGDVLVV